MPIVLPGVAGPPTVTTLPNTADTDSSPTTIQALVDPNELDTQVWFQWGDNLQYSYTTEPIDVGSGDAPVTVSVQLATRPGTYHFAAVAQNSAGIVFGGDQTFDVDDSFTSGVLHSLHAWLTPDMTNYATSLAQMFESVYGIVIAEGTPDDEDYEAGWSTVLDVDECPTWALPYLAQFVGAQVQPGTPDAVARNQIQNLPAQHRGTPAAMISAAQTQLLAPQTVYLLERQSAGGSKDAYHAVVLFYANQIATTEAALISAVEAVKPGGIQITYTPVVGFPWDLAVNDWNADTMTWNETAYTQP